MALARKDLPVPAGFAEDDDPPATRPVDDTRPAAKPADDTRVTPMMEQYIEIKAANPDCLLFYRMGDFYELFFEDAEIASRALGIVLTKRGKHLGRDIPMCGVPIERSDEYLHKLIAFGHRVAVCEQLEDPAEARKRGSKSVVKRDVVRLVTPGTLTEDSLLDARRNNYLLAVARARTSSDREPARFALAWIDISTGEFRITECEANGLSAEIARIEPGEIVVSDALYADAEIAPYLRSLDHVVPLARDVFDGATAERRLADYFGVATTDSFGALSRLELTAAAACITYVERTQIGKRPPLSPPLREAAGGTLAIDSATRLNLELMRTLVGRAARIAARDHRPHHHRGRIAAFGAKAGRSPHRSRRHRPAARRRWLVRVGFGGARRNPSASQRGSRSRTFPHPACTGARRPARSGRHSRRAFRRERTCGPARGDQGPAGGDRRGRDRLAAARCRRSQPSLRKLWPMNCRHGGATAALCAKVMIRSLDEARALARPVAQGGRRIAGALCRGDRHPRSENPSQQRARLFRGSHCPARRQASGRTAQCPLHPSPDTGGPGALHHHRARRAGGEDRQRRRPCARHRA